jgi:hypothetical protein
METGDMALELQDVGSVKVHPEVHAMLKAKAMCQKVEMVTLIRQVLHDYVRVDFDTYSLAVELVKAKGLSGITGDWK